MKRLGLALAPSDNCWGTIKSAGGTLGGSRHGDRGGNKYLLQIMFNIHFKMSEKSLPGVICPFKGTTSEKINITRTFQCAVWMLTS